MKVKFVSQPFLTNGSGFIHQKDKNCFYKIKKSIFPPNYARCEKMLRSKIVHLKETYKFGFDYFLERNKIVRFKKIYKFCFDHFLIKFLGHTKKMLRNKLVHYKNMYKSYFDHFLIGIIVFLINMKNAIK